MNIHTWVRTTSFRCLQVTMTNACSPFGRRTRVTWTLYWTTSSLTLKSPRRIFWSQCLLWVPFFRTCKDGWWYEKSISPCDGCGQRRSSCLLWLWDEWGLGCRLTISPICLCPWPEGTCSSQERTVLPIVHIILHGNSHLFALLRDAPCFLIPLATSDSSFKIYSYLASVLFCYNACLFHERSHIQNWITKNNC